MKDGSWCRHSQLEDVGQKVFGVIKCQPFWWGPNFMQIYVIFEGFPIAHCLVQYHDVNALFF